MFDVATEKSVTMLTMTHGKANALDLEFCKALTEQFYALSADDNAVILTGVGSIFSAGVDLKRILTDGADYTREFMRALDELCATLLQFDRPLIGALNGHAIAGGCVLAQACDVRVMSIGGGKIGVPELQVGVPFPVYVHEVLRKGFPPKIFSQLAFQGKLYSAEEAKALGVVDELAEPEKLLETARKRAESMAALSPEAFRLSKRLRNSPALETARITQEKYGSEIERSWVSDETRARIKSYVERVLGG